MIAAFIGFGALAWAYFETFGRVILPGVTVWIAWYFAVLAVFVWKARNGGPEMKCAASIMVASFAAAHLIWNASVWPLAAHAVKNITVAVLLGLVAYRYSSRPVLAAASIYLALVAIGLCADFGWLFSGRRPMQFIAWSFPDVSAGLQHVSLIVMGSSMAPSMVQHETDGMGWNSRYSASSGSATVARASVPEELPRS